MYVTVSPSRLHVRYLVQQYQSHCITLSSFITDVDSETRSLHGLHHIDDKHGEYDGSYRARAQHISLTFLQ